MARYYDGDLLLKLKDESPYWHFDLYDLEAYLESVPTADVVEVKHSKWKIKRDFDDFEYLMCSCCKEEFYSADTCVVDIFPNYCPNCGAKMDGDTNDKN